MAKIDINIDEKTLRVESLKTLIDRDIKAIKKCELITQAQDYINDLDMAVKALIKNADAPASSSIEPDRPHFYYSVEYQESDYATLTYDSKWKIVDFQEVISDFLSCIDEYGTVVAILPKSKIISIERIFDSDED